MDKIEKNYLIIKKDNEIKFHKELNDELYQKLKIAAASLEELNYLTFLGNSYIKAKEDFLRYDFSQFGVREVDMFNMLLNSLEAMATNRNLWEAYLKRKYTDDSEIYPATESKKKKKKSCFGIKDSEFFDNNIEYVVSKVIRDMIAHHCKPYSEIIYNDDLSRQFIITREDLLTLGNPNNAERKHISNSQYDYYDVIQVIRHSFEVVDELNEYIFNLLVEKEWMNYVSARYTIREHIGLDWQGAYLVKPNSKYPADHLLYLSQTDISKNAMNLILSLAAQSLSEN